MAVVRALMVLVLAVATLAVPPVFAQQARSFTVVTVLSGQGDNVANVWLPSALIVRRGERVTLTLRNVSPADHGFAIDEARIQEIVQPGQTKTVTFSHRTEGVLRYYCHVHPAHIGGQVLVVR
ncbi:MAG: cupredoxin domain-containing protein [Armatimonadota bacterium]|nr:cupredoxin domain-containing protein [Armatimonadota bacterium]